VITYPKQIRLVGVAIPGGIPEAQKIFVGKQLLKGRRRENSSGADAGRFQ